MQVTNTKLLAKKNGDISIVEVTNSTDSYLVLKYAMVRTKTKVFNAERGRVWELFSNVDDAIHWIKSEASDAGS